MEMPPVITTKRKRPKAKIPANTYYFQNKSLTNLPGEKWKELPDYEEYYEISNYGRIKQVGRWIAMHCDNVTEGYLKEKILSQKVFHQYSPSNKDFCFYLTFYSRINKQTKAFKIARWVYYLFVEKYDMKSRSFIIQYKDNNGLNANYENLILSNSQKRQFKTIKRKRTPRLMPVTQFSTEGKRLNYFNTLGEACRKMKGRESGIYSAIFKRHYYYRGFFWMPGDVMQLDSLPPILKNNPKPVVQYTLDGKELKTFSSINSAAKAVGGAPVNLKKVLVGKIRICKGYTWKWKE